MRSTFVLLLALFGFAAFITADQTPAGDDANLGHMLPATTVLSRTAAAPSAPIDRQQIPVNVACVTEDGRPISGAEVTLFEIDSWTLHNRRQAIKLTNGGGLCRFEDVALPDADVTYLQFGNADLVCNVAAQAAGRATVTAALTTRNMIASTATIALVMPVAQKLRGHVTNANGDPLNDALVYFQPPSTFGRQSVAGICCARTDEKGLYEISDLKAWSAPSDAGRFRVTRGNLRTRVEGEIVPEYLIVWTYHPNYGLKRGKCQRIPGTMDVQMSKAGTLEGRITDMTTGQPLASASVWTESQPETRPGRDWTANYSQDWTVTDQNGRYKLNVEAGSDYLIFVCKEAFFMTGPSPRMKDIPAGATTAVPDIPLARAAAIRGRLVDATTHKPIHFSSKPHVTVAIRGPGGKEMPLQPWSVAVNADGTFLRPVLPSGRTYSFSVVSSDPAVKDKRDISEVSVAAGETLEIELPVEPLSEH